MRELGSDLDADRASDPTPNNMMQERVRFAPSPDRHHQGIGDELRIRHAELNSETEGSASIVPNEEPRNWAGLEVDGFPSGNSTSFLKKVRMRSRCEAAMS